MTSIKTNICIPAYNAESSVEKTLKNVLMQTHQTFRVFVYDDGSTDNTVEIVKKLSRQDGRILLIEGRLNRGRSAARNALLEMCRHELIAWQDADDLWHPRKLERLLPLYHNQNLAKRGAILYSAVFRIPPKYTPTQAPIAELLFGKQLPTKLHPPEVFGVEHVFSRNFGTCPFYLQGTIGMADSYIEVGGFDESIGWAEDLDMVVQLLRGGFQIHGHRTENPLTRYYLNVPSVTIQTLYTAIIKAASGGGAIESLSTERLKSDILWRKMYYIFKVALLQREFAFAKSILVEYHAAVNDGFREQWGADLLAKNMDLLRAAQSL